MSKKLPEVDVRAIEHNLSLSVEERLERHQIALETVLELQKAHEKLYEKSKSTSQNTSQG